MPRPIKQHDYPFNNSLPPLFKQGGLLYSYKNLGAKVACAVAMPAGNFPHRDWLRWYNQANIELALCCMAQVRCATEAERSQLEWLRQDGHYPWTEDREPPPQNLNRLLADLRREIRELKAARSPKPRAKAQAASQSTTAQLQD